MKKNSKVLKITLCSAAVAWMASCSNYSHVQDEANKNGPVDCSDLHRRHAEWHFTSQGVQFDVFGDCKKGMRHGNFRFVADGKDVAVVKYSKDEEIKVKCIVSESANRTSLQQCLSAIPSKDGAAAESTSSFGNVSAWDQPIE